MESNLGNKSRILGLDEHSDPIVDSLGVNHVEDPVAHWLPYFLNEGIEEGLPCLIITMTN